MVTISNWIRKETFSYYTSIKHKYLFLKSRRHFRKQGTLFVFQKALLFLLVVLTFDEKLPSRTQNDLNTAIVKDNELFTIQYITTADVIRSNHIKNQSSLYALTKLKFSTHHSYFKYLLILSGDINLHPGPVNTHAPCVPNQSGKELSLVKNAGYGSIKNVTLHLSSKITLQVFVNHVKTNRMTI